jgi:hypothetical protein
MMNKTNGKQTERGQRLQNQAQLILETPAKDLKLKGRSRLNAIFMVWHFSALEQHAAWTVYSPAPRDNCRSGVVQQVVWNYSEDYSRMNDPMIGLKPENAFRIDPGLTHCIAEIAEDQILDRLKSLTSISLNPYIVDRPWGLDGETFGVQMFTFSGESSLSWWGEGPEDWLALTTYWLRQLVPRLLQQ